MLLSLMTAISCAMAKAPALTHLFPAGGQRGSSFEMELGGAAAETGMKVWTDHPDITVVPLGKSMAKVSVGAAVPLGLHWLRLYNAEGASEPRWFSVGVLTETKEAEPNDSLAAPMPVDHLPVCLNGVLEKGGAVDLYTLNLNAGETLTAWLEAYALGSAVDAFLELRGASGEILATQHDGRSLDPVMTFTCGKAGRHVLQVAGFLHPPQSSVEFTGGKSVVYRLHLHRGPVATSVHPAAVSRTSKVELGFSGPLPLPEKERTVKHDASTLPAEPVIQPVSHPAVLWPLMAVVTDAPVQMESEPNDAKEKANPLALFTLAAGRLATAGDRDGYSFTVKKGSYYNLRLYAKELLLPLDAKLSLRAMKDDALLAEQDDADAALADPMLSWKATLDGPVRVVVEDLFGKGGPGAQYVLSVKPGAEPLEAEISSGTSAVLDAGKTVEIKAKLNARYGYGGSISARVQGLPHGVTAEVVEVKPKTGTEFSVKLQAAKNAPAWSGPLELALWYVYEGGTPSTTRAAIRVRGESERGVTQLDKLEHVWLTVKPAAPELPKP
jgi:hypothetical protein